MLFLNVVWYGIETYLQCYGMLISFARLMAYVPSIVEGHYWFPLRDPIRRAIPISINIPVHGNLSFQHNESNQNVLSPLTHWLLYTLANAILDKHNKTYILRHDGG